MHCIQWNEEVCTRCRHPYALNLYAHCELGDVFSPFRAYPGRSLDCCWMDEITQISDSECAERCLQLVNCTGFSYGERKCYLKDGVATEKREQWCQDTRCKSVIHFEKSKEILEKITPNLDAFNLTKHRSEALPLVKNRDLVHHWNQKVCIIQRKIWLLDEKLEFDWSMKPRSVYIDHFYGQEINIGRPNHVASKISDLKVNPRHAYFLPDDYMHHIWHSLTPLMTAFDVLVQIFGTDYRDEVDIIWVSSPKDKTQAAEYNRDMVEFLQRFHMLLTSRVPIYLDKVGRKKHAADECWSQGIFGRPLMFNEPGSTMKPHRYKLFPELMRKQLGVVEVPKFFPKKRCSFIEHSCNHQWNVLLIHRNGARGFHNEHDIKNLINNDGRFHLQTKDLGNLTVEEQAAVVFEADVVIGAHGQALSWVVLLKPGSVTIEMFSEGAWMCIRKRLDYYTNYRFLAKEFSVHHMCWLDIRVGPENLNWKKSEINMTLDRLSHSLDRAVELNQGFRSKRDAVSVCPSVPSTCSEAEQFCESLTLTSRARIFMQFTLLRHQSKHLYGRIETNGNEIRIEDRHRRIMLLSNKKEIIATSVDIKEGYAYDVEIDLILPNFVTIWVDGVYQRTRPSDFDFGFEIRTSICGGQHVEATISEFRISVDNF